VAAALAALKNFAWPWRGPVGVLEEDAARDASELHVVHQWCYLGTARSEAEVPELLEGARRPAFDPDQYRILAKHLSTGRARVIELAGARARR
jgi:DNA polymerase-3 subunit epsilon